MKLISNLAPGIVAVMITGVLLCHPASAATTTLAWDPPSLNTDGTALTNLAGYVVSYGTQSGSYDNSVDVGNVTAHELTGLEDGQVYYATVKAYNTYGLDSDGTSELNWTAPDVTPPSLDAPAQISLTGDDNDQAEVPDVTAQVTVSDNISSLSNILLSQDPAAGTLVGLGTTPITVTATDEAGNAAEAIVDLVVVAMNRPPTVDAGVDQTIRLPHDSVSLEGTVTDDGLPEDATVTVEWTFVSGPAAVTFGDATALNTTASFTEDGTYVLRLTATDTDLTATDDMTVTVTPKPIPMPPSNFHAMHHN